MENGYVGQLLYHYSLLLILNGPEMDCQQKACSTVLVCMFILIDANRFFVTIHSMSVTLRQYRNTLDLVFC